VSQLNLSRQSLLVPEELLTKFNFKIFGVGSVGSHFALALAKTGFKNIEVFDMDTVDEENIGPQAFMFSHLKMKKVDAIATLIKDATNTEIIATDGMITEESIINAEPNTFYCCFFDSFEGRKIVFDKLKDMPIKFVDGRIGGYNARYYIVDCSNEEEVISYGKTLVTGKTSELACGEKASCPINYELAGKLVNQLVSAMLNKPYDKIFIGNVADPSTNLHIQTNRKPIEVKEDGILSTLSDSDA